jgi:pimeloyl-ACP methyl ester carboxylesterase
MPTVAYNSLRVFYEDTGAGDPPMLFLHGIGDHTHFAAQLDYFSRSHRVVAPDLPGFGQSDAPEREYGITAFADDVAWLCDELDLHEPVIVGHSMAGAVALELAAAHPELPSAIVLLDPIPIVPLPALHDQRGRLAEALAGPSYHEAFRAFAEARMFRPTDDPDLRARIVDEMCATPQHVLAPTFASLARWNGEDIARHINVPVLLITAGDGLPADITRTRELLPQLELGRTVAVGHFAHALAPDQINAMITHFLHANPPQRLAHDRPAQHTVHRARRGPLGQRGVPKQAPDDLSASRGMGVAQLPKQAPDVPSASRGEGPAQASSGYDVRSRMWRTVAAYHRAPP